MNNFIIAKDVFDNESWESIYSNENPIEFLQSYYDKFPANAKIYHNVVSLATDVTPNTEEDIDTLSKLEGVFFVMEYPADPVTIIIAIVAVVAVAAIAFLLQPKIPNANGNSQASPNNANLSARQNTARLNGRIPDIYGTVRSVPDLISLPYTFFDSSGIEYELSYMCVGVGEYDISDVREGETPLIQIAGEGCSFYAPNQSPNTGVEQLSIGANITQPLFIYKKQNAINGQSVPSPATGSVTFTPNGASFVTFTKTFIASNTGGFNTSTTCFICSSLISPSFSGNFTVGDTITLTSSTNPTFNGTFTVLGFGTQLVYDGTNSFNVQKMYLSPINTAFTDNSYTGTALIATSAAVPRNRTLTIAKSGSAILGPFTISDTGVTNLLINFIAPTGLNGASAVTIQIKITTIATGAVQTVNFVIPVSTTASQKGYTCNITLTGQSPCTIRIQRTTTAATNGNDEVKIRDLFYGKAVSQSHFGNITTAYVLSRQTVGATAADERKFNCLVTRKLNTLSGFVATNDAAEIIINICLDSKIGRRQLAELDTVGIRSTVAAIKSYFGNAGYNNAGTFNYTFDSTNLSFEETIVSVASAIHCIAYRQDGLIKLKFERDNSLSTLLFNHRNVLPGTQQIAYSFGTINDYDGVTIKYIDPVTDQESVLYIPTETISNPKEIDYVGIRDKAQAYYLGWRVWNKLKYQNMAVNFTATQESDLITLSDRILVAPINRNEIQQGEIIAHSGLQLTLSVDVTVANGDTIFLQYYDGTTGSLTINSQISANIITVTTAPALPLIVDLNAYVRTEFIISRVGSIINLPYIVTHKERGEKFTNSIKAINYDSRYYNNDHTNPATI